MSKLSDYSKFDHLDEYDDSDEDNTPLNKQQRQVPSSSPTTGSKDDPASDTATTATARPTTTGPATSSRMYKDEKTGRFVFEFNGNPIYSWEQTLDDVTIHIQAPPSVRKANQINCNIMAHQLQLGLQGAKQWFINEETFGLVDVSESTWSLEDDDDERQRTTKNEESRKVIIIYLTKANRGVLWESALKGISANQRNQEVIRLDPASMEQVKKDLLLERFQEEHRGMDFRDAEFNGSVPDPRTFMGGVQYQ